MAKVSIIINCYNGEKYLKKTLDSVRDQSFTDYEVIFWDNCSTDRTGEIAKAFGNRLHYFKAEHTVPLGEARNLALEKADSEYIAFLDSDDIWSKNKLSLQVAEMDKNLNVGMICSNYKLFNMMSGKTKVFDKKPQRRVMDFSDFINHYSYCFSSFMVRKSILDEQKYYFSKTLKYAEEFELFVRLAYKWDTIFLPQVMVIYRIHSDMNTMHLKEEQYNEYNVVLDTLRTMDSNMDNMYPEVIRWISFVRDLAGAKNVIRSGDNKKVRELMKPYLDYNIRAKCFYAVSLLPTPVMKFIANSFYRKRF